VVDRMEVCDLLEVLPAVVTRRSVGEVRDRSASPVHM
jgi:hypothetical protein